DILLVAGIAAMGLFFMFGFEVELLHTLTGIYAFLVGVYMVVHYFVNLKQLENSNVLIAGLMLVAAYGFSIVIEAYELIIYFLPIFLGVAGGIGVGEAIQNKCKGHHDWWKKLIFGALTTVLAVLYVVLLRFGTLNIAIVMGVMLLLVAVCYGVERFVLKPGCKKAEKAAPAEEAKAEEEKADEE
ncbi:MAG: hypothetical protein J6T39_02915, partial [Clostridia bacterium]|nr:hypothetical protein [Clostridia bacterium]